MYYTHDFSTERFPTREACKEELLSSIDAIDISEFLAQRVSLTDIILERADRDPENFYEWLDNEIEIATNTYLNRHINEHKSIGFFFGIKSDSIIITLPPRIGTIIINHKFLFNSHFIYPFPLLYLYYTTARGRSQ